MSDWDDDAYDLLDPKHPSYHERMADWSDQIRKAEKEQSVAAAGQPWEQLEWEIRKLRRDVYESDEETGLKGHPDGNGEKR
jgi:hypothetical protein